MKLKPFLYPTIIVFFICAITLNSSYAYDLSLGVGNISSHIGKIQIDSDATRNGLSFRPYIRTALDFNIDSNILISPELAFNLPKSSEDPYTKNMDIYAMLNGKYIYSDFQFILGGGLALHRIWGTSDTETLNNGLGTTSFPLPDHAVYSRNFILNLGVTYNFYTKYYFEAATQVYNLTTKEDRSFSLTMNVNYHFGEIF